MMDATQMICDSILESEEEEHEEEEEEDERGDPLGKLCILKNEHIPEKECLLFVGDNVLGRDPSTCSLPLLAPSVSKQHATISLSVYKRKGSEDEVEALLWDLGSMNGTRKGRLKLTPNVRYALGEGDSLVVADIPCKYIKYTAETDTRTPVTHNQSTKVSDALRENAGNLNTGKTNGVAASTKTKDPLADSGVTQGTPARTGGLEFEKTPTQQHHGSLVPDSGSESDEEKSRVGDRRRKAVVSDSDSYKSSPTCSTFMSPTNKVVPESEDESPITPSSSYKNRTRRVSFNTEESDVDIHRQERKKTAALEIVNDSEEETGNGEAAMAKNGSAKPELPKMEPTASAKPSVVSQFNMDSDTDAEEEEEKLTTAEPPVLLNNAETTSAPKFHMDSDTDVEEEEKLTTAVPPVLSNNVEATNAPKFHMDSDTDVEEEEKLTPAVPPVLSNNTEATSAPKFHMDSDTDVEDDETDKPSISSNGVPKNSQVIPVVQPTSISMDSDTDVEEEVEKLAIAAPVASDKTPIVSNNASNAPEFNLDSDTDVEDEDLLSAATEKPLEPQIANPAVASERANPNDFNFNLDSDTDVEEGEADLNSEMPPRSEAKPVVSKPAAPSGDHFDSDTDDEGVLSAVVCKPPAENEKPDLEILSNSDTDVEDDFPEIQASTPEKKVVQSGVDGEVNTDVNEPVEGQGVDIALQATQAYILQPDSDDDEESGGDQTAGKADQEVDQSVPKSSDERGSEEELEEATQPVDYMSSAPTQPMCFDNDSDSDSEDSAPVFSKRKAKQIEEQETQLFSSVAEAETQPMEMMEDGASEQESPGFRKKKAKRIEEEETQPNSDLTVAQTQPMEPMEDAVSDEDSPVLRIIKEKQLPLEEEATQAIEMSLAGDSDEEDIVHNFGKRKVKRLEPVEDTQPYEELTVAQTQPIPATETDESAGEDSGKVVGKRQMKKLKTETFADSELAAAPTQPVVSSEDIASDEEEEDDIAAPRRRKVRKLEETQSLTNSQADDKDAKEEPRRGEASNVSARPRRGGARSVEEKQETAEEVSAGPQRRQTRGKSKVGPVSKGRRGRAKVEREDDSDTEETHTDDKYAEETKQVKQQDKEMAAELQKEKERERIEEEQREEMERLEKKRMEQEEMAARLQKEREEKEREERERAEKEKKEEMERLERERVEKEKKELEAKRQKEKEDKERERREQEQKEKERLEKERFEKEKMELEAKQQKEKEEREKREREEKERREKEEREKSEKQRIESEKKELAAKRKKEKEEKKQKEMLEKREREEMARKEKEQKEREERERMEAAKQAKAELQRQEKERKDQEQKARLEMEEKERLEKEKQEELNKTKEEAPRRGRRAGRRTIAVTGSSTAAEDDDGPAKRTRSRSNSSNSVGSERSVTSISSQASRGRGRGKGARKTEQERRGRRTESGIVNEEAGSQKTPQRGRRSTRICSEDDKDNQGEKSVPSVSTRGQGGAKDQSSKCTPEKDGKESQEEASTCRRGGRKRSAETDAKSESQTKTQNEVDSSVTRKTGARSTPARKSVKAEIPENSVTQSEKPKGKGRASVVQRKKSEEQGDSGSSGNNSMEQEANLKEQEPPRTPRSSVSRKRPSADPESDPVAKTPRSSATSPATVGRPRSVSQSYKVLFTGVVDEAGEKVLTHLRGSLAKDVADMNCLVTDKVRRTVKFLCAVAKGIPIVTTQWLEKSGKAGTFLPPNTYLVKDREQETKFNFNLQNSLRIASEQPLLQGYEIHVTKSVKPEPVHMKDIITSSGAVFLSRMPSSNKAKTVVISCEEDWSLCAPALSCSVPVVSAEFILTGILQQKVDLETHKLSGPASAPGGRGRGRKKT